MGKVLREAASRRATRAVKAYIDTSVLLRIVLGEKGRLRQWRSIDLAISNELIRVEALRTIDRARIQLRLNDTEVAERRADVFNVLNSFHLATLDGLVLERASEPFPTVVRTLDAIHLATALLVRHQYETLVFATHDRELATAARSVGFRVIGAPVFRANTG
jgi:predicted nucleic acid-binding protein